MVMVSVSSFAARGVAVTRGPRTIPWWDNHLKDNNTKFNYYARHFLPAFKFFFSILYDFAMPLAGVARLAT